MGEGRGGVDLTRQIRENSCRSLAWSRGRDERQALDDDRHRASIRDPKEVLAEDLDLRLDAESRIGNDERFDQRVGNQRRTLDVGMRASQSLLVIDAAGKIGQNRRGKGTWRRR